MPTLIIEITEDCYIRRFNDPDTNYVNSSLLVGTNQGQRSLLKLNPTELESGKHVISATLTLYKFSTSSTAASASIVNITEDWVYNLVTYNTRPALGSISISCGDLTASGEYDFDITEIFKKDYDEGTNYGLSIEPILNDFSFESSRSVLELNHPYITVVYSDTIPVIPAPNYPVSVTVDRADDLKFTWQGANHISTELIWNDGTEHIVNIPGNFFEYTLPGGSMAAATVTWKIRHEYQEIGYSEYSSDVSFLSADKPPTPVITTTTLTTELPTITWTSVNQVAFNLKVSDPSGVVVDYTSFVNNLSYTLIQKLKDDTQYTIELSIQDDSGLWSDYDVELITSNFLKPDAPTFSIINFGDYVDVVINNGANTAYNEVLKLIDGVYTPIKQALEDETVSVYELVSGEVESLIVRAYRDGGGYVDSAAQTTTVNVSDSQIVSYDGSIVLNLSKNPQKNNSTVINASKNLFVGRNLPVSVVGKIKENSPRWTFESFDNEDRVNLNNLIGVKALFRDRRGFIGWFVITSTSIGELVNSYNLSITNVIEVNR